MQFDIQKHFQAYFHTNFDMQISFRDCETGEFDLEKQHQFKKLAVIPRCENVDGEDVLRCSGLGFLPPLSSDCVVKLELKYGCLAVLYEVMRGHCDPGDLKHLKELLNDITFNARLRQIAVFYSFTEEDGRILDPITVEDAFNFLRLHVLGGGIKMWFGGLASGTFHTYDGRIIGHTKPKKFRNAEKSQDSPCAPYRWKRPQGVQALCFELAKLGRLLYADNIKAATLLDTDKISPYYVMESRVVCDILLAVQKEIAVCAMDYLVSNEVPDRLDGKEDGMMKASISPSSISWVQCPCCDEDKSAITNRLNYYLADLLNISLRFEIAPTLPRFSNFEVTPLQRFLSGNKRKEP